MRTKEDPKIQAVEWFLRLISEDLSRLSELNLEKLVIEAKHYLLKPVSSLPFPFHEDFTKSTWIDKESLDQPIEIIGFPEDYPWRDILEYIQTELRKLLEERINDPNFCTKICTADVYFGDNKGDLKISYSFTDLIIGTLYKKEVLTQRLKIIFCYALDGIPTEAIRKCLECEKYFLHLSRKEKYYCSPQCTSRSLSRKNRDADRPGYNAKQREIMRKKYRERLAKKLDKDPKTIKIQAKKSNKNIPK